MTVIVTCWPELIRQNIDLLSNLTCSPFFFAQRTSPQEILNGLWKTEGKSVGLDHLVEGIPIDLHQSISGWCWRLCRLSSRSKSSYVEPQTQHTSISTATHTTENARLPISPLRSITKTLQCKIDRNIKCAWRCHWKRVERTQCKKSG